MTKTILMPEIGSPEQRQEELELEMMAQGAARFTKALQNGMQRGQLANTQPGRLLLRESIGRVSENISAWIEKADTKGAGRRHAVLPYLKMLDPDVAAAITAHVVVNSFCAPNSKQTFNALKIGKAIENEVKLETFYRENRGAYWWVAKEIKRRGISKEHQKLYFYSRIMGFKGVEWTAWSDKARLQLGVVLMELFNLSTGYLKIVTLKERGSKTVKHVRPTNEVMNWLESDELLRSFMRPKRYPMFIVPRPYNQTLTGGGYLLNTGTSFPLVSRMSSGHREKLVKADLQLTLQTVNALGQTKRVIDKNVLGVIQTLWEAGNESAGLPNRTNKELPVFSKEAEVEGSQARMDFRKQARQVHEDNDRSKSKRFLVQQTIDIAERMKDEPVLYFPHQVDFRGRFYPATQGLTPQGADFSRALIRMKVGKPVPKTDTQATGWLMIHGANMFGFDKVSLEDRIGWTEDHTAQIEACVRDPFTNKWWQDADKPFQFLAWAFDYEGVINRGEDSHVPIAMDGSCNGLQHFAAILRDPEAGAAVNLTPSKTPQDIYQVVADRVMTALRSEDAPEHKWIAETWATIGVDRKMVKRPVMVMPYGGQLSSTIDYVEEAYRGALGDRPNPFGDAEQQAVGYLGKLVYDTLRLEIKAGTSIMKWLQDVARICTKARIPMAWTTPSGFVARQWYPKERDRRIVTKLQGGIITNNYLLEEVPHKVNARASTNGISPNFIHALDASVLALTVDYALQQGINNFQMIHDDYGTHAADTDTMFICLRRAFVDMYEDNDVLASFAEEISQSLPADMRSLIPSPPPKGTLDLLTVMKSDFFFA